MPISEGNAGGLTLFCFCRVLFLRLLAKLNINPEDSMHQTFKRRSLVLLATAAAIALPGLAFAQAKTKVAALYTVPFEQQWVSRLHKALKAAEARGEIEYKATENVSNADYERVMREYATAGNTLIVGEAFAVEAAARKVAKDFPKVSFLMGSSGKPQAPNFSVFDNYIQEPAYLSGMIAGGVTKTNKIGMVGGFPIPEGQPPDERLHGRRQGNQPQGRVQREFHQQLV